MPPSIWEQDEDAIVIVTQEEGGTAAPPPSCSRNRISTNVLRPPCTSPYDTFLHLLREPRAQGDHGRGCVLRANAAHSHRDREKGDEVGQVISITAFSRFWRLGCQPRGKETSKGKLGVKVSKQESEKHTQETVGCCRGPRCSSHHPNQVLFCPPSKLIVVKIHTWLPPLTTYEMLNPTEQLTSDTALTLHP